MSVQKTILPDGRIGSKNNTGRSYVRVANAARFDKGRNTKNTTQEIRYMDPMSKKAFVMGLIEKTAKVQMYSGVGNKTTFTNREDYRKHLRKMMSKGTKGYVDVNVGGKKRRFNNADEAADYMANGAHFGKAAAMNKAAAAQRIRGLIKEAWADYINHLPPSPAKNPYPMDVRNRIMMDAEAFDHMEYIDNATETTPSAVPKPAVPPLYEEDLGRDEVTGLPRFGAGPILKKRRPNSHSKRG